jgi:hypothetical protein
MRFRIAWKMTAAALMLGGVFVSCVAGSRKTLTVDRIWSQPSLNGRPLRRLARSPDGERLGYFPRVGRGRNTNTGWATTPPAGSSGHEWQKKTCLLRSESSPRSP